MQSYASFWQRFAAGILDTLILLPFLWLFEWASIYSRTVAELVLIPQSALYPVYSIYFHGTFGQTLGKRAMGIRVVRKSGEAIGWKQAWLRSSVDLGFMLLGCLSELMALNTISDANFYGSSWIDISLKLESMSPWWLGLNTLGDELWGFSEIITMLLNKRRRALHDFLAGTIVVRSVKNENTAVDSRRSLLGGIFSGILVIAFVAVGFQLIIKQFNDHTRTVNNVVQSLNFDPRSPLTGLWKEDCADKFGIALEPALTRGKYRLLFCGLGKCVAADYYDPKSVSVDDSPNTKIIDFPNKIGSQRYLRCD